MVEAEGWGGGPESLGCGLLSHTPESLLPDLGGKIQILQDPFLKGSNCCTDLDSAGELSSYGPRLCACIFPSLHCKLPLVTFQTGAAFCGAVFKQHQMRKTYLTHLLPGPSVGAPELLTDQQQFLMAGALSDHI